MASRAEIDSNFNPNSLEPQLNIPKTNISKSESSTSLPPEGEIVSFKPEQKTPEQTRKKPKNEIANWLKQIENAPDDENRQKLIGEMKQFLYEKKVIKPENIPHTHYKNNNIIIEIQKSSLDQWVDYLTSDKISDETSPKKQLPSWAKVWALHGALRMERSEINKNGEIIFEKRGKNTTAPFPELNEEILEKTIKQMEQKLEKLEKQPAPEKDQKELRKKAFNKQYKKSKKLLSPKKFSKLYEKFTNEYDQKIPKQIQGEWRHFSGPSDAHKLIDSYKGHNVPWCSANLILAEYHLQNSDYNIYYTHDVTGKATVPRVLVRIRHSGEEMEIRGTGYRQNIDKDISPFIGNILEKKYEEKAEEYQKKAEDIQMLAKIEEKQKNNKPLSQQDLRFLYEIDRPIEVFGRDKDPRIQEIIDQRNIKTDLAYALSTMENQVSENQISLTKEEALKDILHHYGDLDLDDLDSLENIKLPKQIGGDLSLAGLTSLKNLILPKNFNGVLCLGYKYFNENHPEIIQLRKEYSELKIQYVLKVRYS